MKTPTKDPIVACLLLFSALLSVWLGIAGPLISDATKEPYRWFKDFYPLLGAIAAGIGVYIAWKNVGRQLAQARETLTINLISREEDRIEVELPGLELAANFMARLSFDLSLVKDNDTPLDRLRAAGLSLDQDEMRAAIESRLQLTDANTKLHIAEMLNELYFRAKELHSATVAERHAANSHPTFDPSELTGHADRMQRIKAAQSFYNSARHEFSRLQAKNTARIQVYRKRKDAFRKRIEAAFDDI